MHSLASFRKRSGTLLPPPRTSAAALSAAVDSTPKQENRAPVTWARTSKGTNPPIPSHSSGEGGLGGEALLLEKRPLPPAVPPPPLFGREREGGKDSHSRQWRLSMAVFLNRNKRPSAAPIEVAEASRREAPPSHLSLFIKAHLFELFAGDEDLARLCSGGGADDAATGHLVN